MLPAQVLASRHALLPLPRRAVLWAGGPGRRVGPSDLVLAGLSVLHVAGLPRAIELAMFNLRRVVVVVPDPEVPGAMGAAVDLLAYGRPRTRTVALVETRDRADAWLAGAGEVLPRDVAAERLIRRIVALLGPRRHQTEELEPIE